MYSVPDAVRRSEILRRCVGDVGVFFEKYWMQRPLHRTGVEAGAFADIFGVDDVDTLIAVGALQYPAFRLVKDVSNLDLATYTKPGREESSRQLDPGQVYRLLGEGASIVLQSIPYYWEPLMRFCRQLEMVLTYRINANAYLTPPGAQALPAHSDDHDVLVFQLTGRKQWQVDGSCDLEMSPGDVLYIPKGRLHQARTTDTYSLHLTIGIYPYSWRTVFEKKIEQVLESFDDPLPPGFADDPDSLIPAIDKHIQQLIEEIGAIDTAELVEQTAHRFWGSRPPILTGQLRNLLSIDDFSDRTVFRRRPDAVCMVRQHDDQLDVTLGDRELTMPAFLLPMFERILAGESFTAKDFADRLDVAGRLVLVRRLTREGLIEPILEHNR